MEGKLAKDPLIAALADAQHGVVNRAHLLNAGFTRFTRLATAC